MKKVLLSLVIALGLVACGEKTEAPKENEKPVVKIGVTLPLTGNVAEAGQAAKAGLEMTLEDLQQKGLKYDYKLIFEDNQMTAMKTATNVNKFIFSDKVDAIFSMWDMTSNIVASTSAKHNIFSFVCSYGRTANVGEYSFNLISTYEDQAELMLDEFKERDVKSVAMFVDNGGIMKQFEVIENYIKNQSDIKIVFKEYFNPGEKDYKSAILKASSQQPDIYIISGYPPSPYLFLKQLKEITGRNDNVTAVDAIAEIDKEHLSIANNLWYIDSNSIGLDAFQQRLKKRKNIQSNSCAGSVASNLEVFISAVENTSVIEGLNKPTKEDIRKWIFDNIKDYETASGKATVLDDGFIAVKPSVRRIQNGIRVSDENK